MRPPSKMELSIQKARDHSGLLNIVHALGDLHEAGFERVEADVGTLKAGGARRPLAPDPRPAPTP